MRPGARDAWLINYRQRIMVQWMRKRSTASNHAAAWCNGKRLPCRQRSAAAFMASKRARSGRADTRLAILTGA